MIGLAILPYTASAAEWPAWQLLEGKGAVVFGNGDSVTLEAAISSFRNSGLGQIAPNLPVLAGDLPPHALVAKPPEYSDMIPAEVQMLEIDLSNMTITPDTTFGLGDLTDQDYRLTLLDSDNNILSLTDVQAEHFNITYSTGGLADLDIELDRATGILPLSSNHDGGTYNQSGLTLFTNLPAATSSLTLHTTQISFSEGIQVFIGRVTPNHSYLDGNKLILPVASAGGSAYYVESTIEQGNGPTVLVVTYAEQLENPDTTYASFYDAGILTVVNAEVYGERYWGQFELIGDNPIRLRLLTANIDDEDDDDDGIPDSEDPFPYEPA